MYLNGKRRGRYWSRLFHWGKTDMTITVADIMHIMEDLAPLKLADSWDNPGLQVGHDVWPVNKLMVALDPTPEVINDAVDKGMDMLITHHPLIFNPIKSVDLGTPIGNSIHVAVQNRLAIYSAHTNLDSVKDGLNDMLVSRIGLIDVSVLEADSPATTSSTESMDGLGRIGSLSREISLAELCRHLKQTLHLDTIRRIGSPDQKVKRVAVCTGSGSGLLESFFSSGAHVYITGDIRYHDARKAEERGNALIDIGHFNSEHVMVGALCDRLTERLADKDQPISVTACEIEKDPFVIL